MTSVEMASSLRQYSNDSGSASPRCSEEAESQPLSTRQPESQEMPEISLLHDAAMSPRAWFGYLSQYFAVGLIYGGLPSTVYGVFNGYLNVPAHVYATIATVMTLPWSLKFVFGMINDCFPILGYHRKPYMVIGWSFCAATLLYISCVPLPSPYWCRDANGEYITSSENSTRPGNHAAAEPCNADAAKAGGPYALLMMLAALGYVIADVAADGLTVQLARREPIESRGRTQTTAYLTRTCGQVCASVLVGFGMNGQEYNGSYKTSLSFNQVCAVLAVPAAAMVPISAWCVEETRAGGRSVSLRQYGSKTYRMLQSRAMLAVVLFNFLTPMVGSISTTSGGMVKSYWAGVKNLQNQLFSIMGSALFATGLWLVKRHFLSHSWRGMLLTTGILLNCIDMPFVFLTVFDVVRNQYFYLGETVLVEVPYAANFVVSTFVIVEMAEEGNEGLVYGLLTTTANLGSPVARAIGNQLFGLFRPSLSDSANYIADTPAFRGTVASSFALSYAFSFASLGFLWLLPQQKEDAQRRKREWDHRPLYAIATVLLLSVALTYSLSVNFLSMFESTMCLKFAGGAGC